jgi:hypothetical protein
MQQRPSVALLLRLFKTGGKAPSANDLRSFVIACELELARDLQTHSNMSQISEWNELRRIADEFRVKLHLAGMDARDRWQALEPRLTALGKTIERGGEHTEKVMAEELASVGKALRELRDSLAHQA